jgi:hypothetical protein
MAVINPVSKICQHCNKPRAELPSKILVCLTCDVNNSESIPNLAKS